MNFFFPILAFAFLLFPSSHYFLLHYGRIYDYYYDYIESTYFSSPIESEQYDFIVVGSGSSGTVVAHRLAQHYNVLLLEAGGTPSELSSIPGFALYLLGYSEHDWNYMSVPQENVLLSHYNKQIPHNRGKVLGGCSTLNYMLYLRGHPLDYDTWANITGDQDWNYDNLLPFFKKSIKEYKGKFQKNKKHYESSPYGFLTIEQVQWGKMLDNFLEAGAELGLNGDIDANGPQISGVGETEVTQRMGKRNSLYAAILEGKSRKNLRISKYSQVTKVKLDKSGRAVGVWFYKHGKKYFAKASKEVILSGGSYDSPKLLMLSGIGPKAELESLGIKSRINLPVGKNLQDHFGVLLMPFVSANNTSHMIKRDLGLADLYEYLVHGTGYFTSPTTIIAQLFSSTSDVKGVDWPNFQSFFIPLAPSTDLVPPFSKVFNIDNKVLEEAHKPVIGKDGFSFLSLLVRPESRGEVTLRDKNPFSDPVIDTRPFSHPADVKALTEGLNTLLKLVETTEAFKKVEGSYDPTPLSVCSSFKFRSDAYWECYIRHLTLSVWHPVGTCKMSHATDPTAVVDSQLRVLHTRGLRVIDSSIMPLIVNANTNAPAILIGEKGADSILDYWSTQYLVCDKFEPLTYFFDRPKCYYSSNI